MIPGNPKRGAKVAIEPLQEWKIHEIGFDGVERYMMPETYSDHVGKLARQVDWKKIVGTSAVCDNPNLDFEESDEDEDEEEKEETIPLSERAIPEAGPWHGVAKNLHEVLQQMNVLIDNLAVMRNTDYVKPLTTLDPLQTLDAARTAEAVQNSKTAQWIWRRRALAEGADVLDKSHLRFSSLIDSDGHSAKGQFFSELKKMREYWRVRKTGEYIYGDLGYHIFGSKYNSRELFDITRRSTPVYFRNKDLSYAAGEVDFSESSPSVLQVTKYHVFSPIILSVWVTVPRDLMRRSTISVSVVKDDETTRNIFASLDDSQFEYMRLDEKRLETIHWQHALKWAQEALICRDTFETLCTEAVQMSSTMSTIRDGVLLVSLFDGYLLRIELKHYPFVEGPLVADGESYLNRSLRQLIVARECSRWIRPQIHVSQPLSNLAESLDIRGAKAFTEREIDERAYKPQRVLEKMVDVANHYSLVTMVIDTLKEICLPDPDPMLQWRFLRSTPTSSLIMLSLSNKNFDHVIAKHTHYLKITSTGVSVSGKDSGVHECYRDRRLLTYTIKGLICTFAVNTVTSLGKTWWWMQVLHANMNAINNVGETCPTLFLCNHSSSRQILMQFSYFTTPTLKIRKFVAKPSENPGDDEFTLLNYNRIPGSSLCKKMDNLFALLRESETIGPI